MMRGAILMGLGFSPLAASGLSLIANTAPVAYGALGTPIAGLASVTGLDPYLLGAMVGRQLPFFSLAVPFWLIWTFAGRRGMLEIWPAVLVCGVSFRHPAISDFQFHQPVDRRHRCVADLDGVPDRLPSGLAATRSLAVAGLANARRIRRRQCLPCLPRRSCARPGLKYAHRLHPGSSFASFYWSGAPDGSKAS